MARLEGTVIRFFDNLAKTHLLILDDFGLTHLEKQQQGQHSPEYPYGKSD